MPTYCGNCGTQLPPDANFCANCKAPTTYSYDDTGVSISQVGPTLPGKNRATFQPNIPVPSTHKRNSGLLIGVLSGVVVSLLIVGGVFAFLLPGLKNEKVASASKGGNASAPTKNVNTAPLLQPTATSSPVPAQNCGGAFSDTFHSNLHSGWNWVDPTGHSTYQVSPQGFLTISTAGGNDLNPATNYSAPRLLQPITGNFVAKTSIDFTQNQPYGFQAAGILLWQDRNNFIRLDKNPDSIDFEQEVNGIFTHEAPPETPTNITELKAELQLQRTGDSITASWRLPGESSWKQLNTIPFNFHDTMIGLALIGSGSPNTTANYKYFKVSCT